MRFLLDRFTKRKVRGRVSFDIDQKDSLGNTCLHTTLYKTPCSTNIVEMMIMAGGNLLLVPISVILRVFILRSKAGCGEQEK